MLTVYTNREGLPHRLDGSVDQQRLAQGVWIDMMEPTKGEEEAVETLLGIDVPSREEMRR